MKEGIHPNYNQTTITCACGNVLEVGSTDKKQLVVEQIDLRKNMDLHRNKRVANKCYFIFLPKFSIAKFVKI